MRALALLTLLAACSSDSRSAAPGGGEGGGGEGDVGMDAGEAGADAATPVDAGGGDRPADAAGPQAAARPDPDVVEPSDAGDAGPPDTATPGCSFEPGPADRDRVVLLGHPFAAEVGEHGTEVRGLTLYSEGDLVDDGVRLDVGTRPRQIALLPGGKLALVLGEDGALVAVHVAGAGRLEVVDRVALPSASYGSLTLADGGETAFVSGSNSTATGGISTVEVACDGSLTLLDDHFYPLRLTDALTLLPGERRALVRGGQALFDPEDHHDLRLLERVPDGWHEQVAIDLFVDHVSTAGIGLAPDGLWALVPNHSIFSDEGSQVAVVDIGEDTLDERQRLLELRDPQRLQFAPDGSTVLLTLAEPGAVVVLVAGDDGVEEAARVGGIGLADQMAAVERGSLAGLVLLPSVDPAGGPNVAMLQITGPGEVRDLGQLELGRGSEQIPTAIAVVH